ncbi:MAG: serine kinase [Planctomycetota bacterium]
MKLSQIAEQLDLEDLTPALQTDAEVTAGHASDLLSDVLANAPSGGVLVTIQVHMNVVAVALHAGLAAVVFASERTPEVSVRERAEKEGIKLYLSKDPTFEIVGKLYSLGLRGSHG